MLLRAVYGHGPVRLREVQASEMGDLKSYAYVACHVAGHNATSSIPSLPGSWSFSHLARDPSGVSATSCKIGWPFTSIVGVLIGSGSSCNDTACWNCSIASSTVLASGAETSAGPADLGLSWVLIGDERGNLKVL